MATCIPCTIKNNESGTIAGLQFHYDHLWSNSCDDLIFTTKCKLQHQSASASAEGATPSTNLFCWLWGLGVMTSSEIHACTVL